MQNQLFFCQCYNFLPSSNLYSSCQVPHVVLCNYTSFAEQQEAKTSEYRQMTDSASNREREVCFDGGVGGVVTTGSCNNQICLNTLLLLLVRQQSHLATHQQIRTEPNVTGNSHQLHSEKTKVISIDCGQTAHTLPSHSGKSHNNAFTKSRIIQEHK